MKAWAKCPKCSWRSYDLQIRVEPHETHGGVTRRCPKCDRRKRLSIGPPVLKSGR